MKSSLRLLFNACRQKRQSLQERCPREECTLKITGRRRKRRNKKKFFIWPLPRLLV